jgi:hypothetical protein
MHRITSSLFLPALSSYLSQDSQVAHASHSHVASRVAALDPTSKGVRKMGDNRATYRCFPVE